MVKLIIAEKAIAGRRIASILAQKEIPAQEFGKTQVFRFEKGGEEYVVLPLRGHIVDVDFPKSYSYWTGVDLRKLVKADIEYVGKETNIISGLVDIAKDVDEVIVATDADREGESIGVEALNYVKNKNPEIKIHRAYFSAITTKDIEDAFGKLSKVDYNFADSADSRREIDLVWGAVMTRFLSLVSGQLGKDFLSAGRVQTPVLALIVDREKMRLAFKAEKYWVLTAICEKGNEKFLAEHKTGKFTDKAEAEKAFATKADKGMVKAVQRKKRVIARPTPFNTTQFIRSATALGMSAGEAMNHAESLYQQGYISYPRTDNTVYNPTINLATILEELKKVPEFSPISEKILSKGELNPSKGEKETKDHPPIHPVSAAPKSKLSEKQWRVYELVVRRFFATLAEDALTENLSVDIDIAGQPYVARGQTILQQGWKEYYPYSKLTEVILPQLKEGDFVKVLKQDMEEKETQPPARYSQSSLIKLMEELGLGTKATRHEIIQKIYNRHYISGLKAIEPNRIAFAVIDSLGRHAKKVTEPQMTAELENEMDLVASGKSTRKQVVDNSREMLEAVLEVLLTNKNTIGQELRNALQEDSLLGTCNKCRQGQMRKLKSRNNKWFAACNRYPQCMNTFPLPQKGKISATGKICEHCSTPMIQVFGTRGRYEMCLDMNCVTKAEWKKKAAEKAEREIAKKQGNKQAEDGAADAPSKAKTVGAASVAGTVKKPRKASKPRAGKTKPPKE